MRTILMHSTIPTDGSTVPVWDIWTPTPSGGGPTLSISPSLSMRKRCVLFCLQQRYARCII
jgi:hypothetical protein